MLTSAATSPTETVDARSVIPVDIVERYHRARPTSAATFARARASMPGAETRAVTYYWPFPTVIDRGEGAELVDVDGLRYIDVVNNYTSLVHGNAQPEVAAALGPVLRRGTVFPALHDSQIALAEALVARIPAVELLRFTNSGSEASALALRIARRATGRRSITIAEGGYHGAVPPFTSGEPEITRTPYNDISALQSTITDDTAAVFMEPFLGAGGVIPGDPVFLHAVQRRAREVGAIFVLDEIQSLRNAPRGMADSLGLQPDLITLAKLIGGGLPIGAVGGRADLLELTSPLVPGRLDHAGTLNGNVAACVAGRAALRRLDAAAIDWLNTAAEGLALGIEAAGEAAGLPVTVTRAGSILNVHPGSAPVRAPRDAGRAAGCRAALHLGLLVEGIYTTPRGMINLSTALTPRQLDRVRDGYTTVLERLVNAPALLAEATGDAA
ncbi:aminotransferase class III-fold pyridoxal phosphate-dependent enzyme [Microbacterium trichothecenolyticum]|uniref:aminotransferase class III-fold pyridoxal phosphate-dependent enzyme n=1 Tax=Microbacterium trichothecenolyticum TaxID=69370 RepID=UPI001C6E85B0|nr:aminotransferase class III-fold pyridoxal phosphate-dependent enzyme [Microbacterium trichothecenolyticum]MBW9121937.1 aminotransferase class III-fold pyridoxal phosphate-dependent enzyme [Microbacterium trichothecenolyticum]